ncbi:ribokinase [Rhodococcus sp. OK519]|uniref:ribokinase n=1 Tax=Rhodococcus sp. OK519 TaxID=2135729 RepID=UPI000D3D3EE4|nr:ribokinase [Rhodococcus sp. OK519]
MPQTRPSQRPHDSDRASPAASPEIVVVGSVNVDTVIRVPRLPAPGETVLGTGVSEYVGGKGANQAVAAARLGRRVGLVGAVGDDADGRAVREALGAEGIDLVGLGERPGARTGAAVVQVDDSGENCITVLAGANGDLDAAAVRTAADDLRRALVTVVQLEIPDDAVTAAIVLAGGTVVLNPSPARPVSDDVLSQVDVLIVNRSELAVLAVESEPETAGQAAAMAGRLSGPAAVVVTLGADGAVLVRDGGAIEVPAVPVEQVTDPTGAGDTFAGALADALVRGESLDDAVRWAVRAAAITVTGPGAQSAMPTRDQVLAAHDGCAS